MGEIADYYIDQMIFGKKSCGYLKNRRNKQMAKNRKQEAEGFVVMEVKGVAKDANAKFPITFDYGESGNAYFVGCRLHATNERGFTTQIDARAFGDVAEELATVGDGNELHVKGEYGLRKGSDDRYYPILTITEVISVD